MPRKRKLPAKRRARKTGVYLGRTVYAQDKSGVWRHFPYLDDGPDLQSPLTWVDLNPLSEEPTEGAHFRYAEPGDPSHMDAYNRRELELNAGQEEDA